MDGTTRTTLVSLIDPVRFAGEALNNQMWAIKAEPNPRVDELLDDLDTLIVEAGRARTLVQRVADERPT